MLINESVLDDKYFCIRVMSNKMVHTWISDFWEITRRLYQFLPLGYTASGRICIQR